MDPENIKSFKRKFPGWIFAPLDKNTSRAVAMCSALYWEHVHKVFRDDERFELLGEWPSVEEAEKSAMDLMWRRTPPDLRPEWRMTKKSKVPAAYVLPKNKIAERARVRVRRRRDAFLIF